jgi:SP family facilitated glucose transporter-like MFS transporter 1
MVDPVSPPTGGGGKKQGLNPRIGFAIAAGAIGSSFQHGYNTGVLNAPEGLIKNWTKSYVCPDVLNETIYDKGKVELGSEALEEWESLNTACDTSVTFIWSFVVAIFCIGGMMGGSVSDLSRRVSEGREDFF